MVIQYRNGMRAFPDFTLPMLSGPTRQFSDKTARKALFLNPHYSDRFYLANILIQRYCAGIESPIRKIRAGSTSENLVQNAERGILIRS